MKSVSERFWEKVEKGPGCWEWLSSKWRDGYGRFSVMGRRVPAHRVSWELSRSKIPDGLVIDHLCKNTSCVNPDHLEPVTSRENTRRGNVGKTAGKHNSAKTHCRHGHEFSKKNTYVYPDGRERGCRTCQKNAYEKLKLRRKQSLVLTK